MQGFIALIPDKDVTAQGGYFVAASQEPWLRLPDGDLPQASGYYELEYSLHICDDPVRPLLRIITDTEIIERALPGPVVGIARCQIYFPKNVSACFISPVMTQGIFSFRMNKLVPVKNLVIFSKLFRRRPGKLFSIGLAYLFGYKKEMINAIDWVINTQHFDEFETWLKRSSFGINDSFQYIREVIPKNQKYLLIIRGEHSSDLHIEITCNSLKSQRNKNYSIIILRDNKFYLLREGLTAQVSPQSLTPIVLRALLNLHDYIFYLPSGATLHPSGFDIVERFLQENKPIDILYFDEIQTKNGTPTACFKPNWSPLFYSHIDYVGSNVILSAKLFLDPELLKLIVEPAMILKKLAKKIEPSRVAHIRRFLITCPNNKTDVSHIPTVKINVSWPSERPSVSIIIPTKDRRDLIEPCVESILSSKLGKRDEIIIIDNQTTNKKALNYLTNLDNKYTEISIHLYEKLFNYSAMNNYGVRKARGDVFVFLNNDTEILTDDWLDIFVSYATDPKVGAIGPCLLFPNKLIQHSGIVVGLGQDAGHFESFQNFETDSWLSRNNYPHEISGITGACMAIERSKYCKIGGFDDDNFPVEFSDLDLCLRLLTAGYHNIYTPEIKALHKESATRGRATTRPLSVYEAERLHFQSRWRHFIRDDPYYHPGMSLYALKMALN